MNIYRAKDYEDMSRKAAHIMAAQIILKPDSVLGLATGSSPVGMYKQLADWCQNDGLNFSRVTTVNLDEYCGLAPENPQSYRYFMNENLFSHVNLNQGNTHLPDGLAKDVDAECARYDALIESLGGIDMQLLGIGHNGHIGFNEPCDHFVTETNAVTLTESTIAANRRFFEREEDVPKMALTMGIMAIMRAKRILVVVSGPAKAAIVKEAFFGPITPLVPASILQLHKDVTLVGDETALAKIPVNA